MRRRDDAAACGPSYDARVETVARIQRALRVPQPIDLAIAGAIAAWALVEAVAVDGPGTAPLRILVALPYAVPLRGGAGSRSRCWR